VLCRNDFQLAACVWTGTSIILASSQYACAIFEEANLGRSFACMPFHVIRYFTRNDSGVSRSVVLVWVETSGYTKYISVSVRTNCRGRRSSNAFARGWSGTCGHARAVNELAVCTHNGWKFESSLHKQYSLRGSYAPCCCMTACANEGLACRCSLSSPKQLSTDLSTTSLSDFFFFIVARPAAYDAS
jgi:hypothetical protein